MMPVEVAAIEVGVREHGGNNRGTRVEEYQRENGGVPGESWCADFACFCLRRGDPPPTFASSRRAMGLWEKNPGARRTEPVPGGLFIIDHGDGKGHVGFVESIGGGDFTSIEGNTDAAGGREGFEVARRIRRIAECLGFLDFYGDPGAVPAEVA